MRQIEPEGSEDGNYMKLSIGKKRTAVMIMDPDLQVHVYSGILPVAKAGKQNQAELGEQRFLFPSLSGTTNISGNFHCFGGHRTLEAGDCRDFRAYVSTTDLLIMGFPDLNIDGSYFF